MDFPPIDFPARIAAVAARLRHAGADAFVGTRQACLHYLNGAFMPWRGAVIVTTDGAYRRGSEIKLKPAVDEAAVQCPSVRNVVVYRRTGSEVSMSAGRDHWWHEIIEAVDAACPAEPLDSEHPLYILYTSGTTGKPKGILHTTGGYLTQAAYTARVVFDLKDDDVYWCTADIGWVTGHS